MVYLVIAENGSVTAFPDADKAAHKAKVDGGAVVPVLTPPPPAPAAPDPVVPAQP